VRSVAFCNAYLYIIMKAVNGLLMAQRQITLKDVYGDTMLENVIGHVCQTLSYSLADTVDTI